MCQELTLHREESLLAHSQSKMNPAVVETKPGEPGVWGSWEVSQSLPTWEPSSLPSFAHSSQKSSVWAASRFECFPRPGF